MKKASLDFHQTVAELRSRTISFFASDEMSIDLESNLRDHTGLSVQEASFVQCVGMNGPVDLLRLYQPTRFKDWSSGLDGILSTGAGSVVFAGPGQGKTTLLKYILLKHLESERLVPILFTLRTE
jgi:hypothetical protein